MNAIEVEHLFFSYNALPVLEDVSFTIKPLEFIAIFGPNGGGKTTLLQLLMGFLKPNAGKILIFDKLPVEARLRIGWVPQTFYFDRSFPISVQEVILGGRLNKMKWYGSFSKEDHRVVAEVLEKVGLKDFLKVPFSTLSGGQMQRVLIARALASQPSLLLLDEPTASIDPHAQAGIYALLNSLKKEITILMVTHHLHQAVQQADRLLCVQKTVSSLTQQKVCEHYALGLYHLPQEEKS